MNDNWLVLFFAVVLILVLIILPSETDMYNNFKSDCNTTFGVGNWTEASYRGFNISNTLIYTKTNWDTVTCIRKEIKGVIKP